MLARWRFALLSNYSRSRRGSWLGCNFFVIRRHSTWGFPIKSPSPEVPKLEDARTQARLFAPKLYEANSSYVDLQRIMTDVHLNGASVAESTFTELFFRLLETILLRQFNALLHPFTTILLSLPIDLPSSSERYNEVLRIIARQKIQTNATRESLLRLLTAERFKKLKLDSQTYETLFAKSLVTSRFTTVLKERMVADGYRPSDTGLLYLMSAAAREGKGKIAARYAKTARSLARQCLPKEPKPNGSLTGIPIAPKASLRSPSESDGVASEPNIYNLLAFASLRNRATFRRHFLYLRKAKQFRRFNGEPPRRLPIHFWGQMLSGLARDKAVTASQIYRMLRMLEKQPELSCKMSARFYNVVLSCLLNKGSETYHLALNVWKSLKARYLEEDKRQLDAGVVEWNPWKMDRYSVSLGIQMFGKMGRYADAFLLVDNLTSGKQTPQASVQKVAANPEDDNHIPHDIIIDPIVFQTLFSELNRAGRADVLWILWAEMGNRYSFSRDDELLSLLMNAATFNSAGGEQFIKDRPWFGLDAVAYSLANKFSKTITSRRYARLQLPLEGLSFADKVQAMLNTQRPLPQDVLWDGLPGWQRARLLFLEVLLGNHPGLERVENPVPLRGVLGQNGPTTSSPISPLEASLTPSSSPYGQHIEFQNLPTIHDIPKPPHSPLYPEIALSDRLFRSYIVLLGEHLLEDQIPVALAWMRALGMKPNKWTVAIALVYFRRATHDQVSPLDDKFRGTRITGEYRTFLDWLIIWLGKESMPTEQETWKAEQRIGARGC